MKPWVRSLANGRAMHKTVQATTDAAPDLRRSLRLVVLSWMVGVVWMSITTGAALTRFAQALEMPKFGFGLLAAIPFAGALAQLPGGWLVERYGRHRLLLVAGAMVHRLLWMVVALLPWIPIPEPKWPWFLAVAFASSLLGHATYPVWVSWMAWLVPQRIRGRYFSRRTQFSQAVNLLTTLAMALILDWAASRGPGFLLPTVSLAFVLAALFGAADLLFFIPVPTPPPPPAHHRVDLWQMVVRPLRDSNFRRFLRFTATLTFATGYIGPFVWLYLFDVVRMTNLRATVMLMAVPGLVTMVAYPVWGRLIDRLGRKPVLVAGSALIVHGAIVWAFITRDHWVVAYLLCMVATFAWPGVELANFNVLLGMAETTGTRYATAHVAINSMVVALTGILSGLFGGYIAQTFADWHGSILGRPLTYHAILFGISGLLRMLAVAWASGLEDRRATNTRAALQYMGRSLYSEVQEIALFPARMLVRLSRWTYRLK